MKNYNEIAKTVFERRDKYEEEQKIKKQNIAQISTAVVCLVLMTAVSFGIVRKNWLKAHINILLPFQTTDSSATSDAINATTADKATTFPLTVPTTFMEPQTTTSPTPYEDWESKSMPGKFCTLKANHSQHLSTIDESDSYSSFKEYVYPFGSREEKATTRSATLLVTDIPLEATAPDGTTHQTLVDIYSLSGLSDELAVGVKFKNDDRIYTYVCSSYIPQTLGEFLEAIDYDNTVSYGGIMLYTGNLLPVNDKNRGDIKTYLFSDGGIANKMDADGEASGYTVTATVNCRELGREGKIIRIHESGHIITNLIGYEYSFFVGKEAVENFLKESYNTTFEEIAAIASTTQPLTSPTTTTAPSTSAVPTTTPPETIWPAEPIDTSTSVAVVIAEEPPVISDVTTTAIQEYAVETATTNDTWWCGTETE